MRGIRPPALFELRAHEWRNAVDLRHLPEGTHSLAPRPGALGRWTFPALRANNQSPIAERQNEIRRENPSAIGYRLLAITPKALVLPVRIALTLRGV